MDYQTTFLFPSEVVSGVVFTLNRPTAVRRAALLLMTSEIREHVRKLLAEARTIAAQPEDQRDNTRFDLILQLVQAQVAGGLDLLYLQWGLQTVEGFSIDGKTPGKCGGYHGTGGQHPWHRPAATIKGHFQRTQQQSVFGTHGAERHSGDEWHL